MAVKTSAKPSYASINKALPRFTNIRKNWMAHGMLGWVYGRFLEEAYADLDENGDVEDIIFYGNGDVRQRRHFYNYKNTVEITKIIEEIILAEPQANPQRFRASIIREIQEKIIWNGKFLDNFAERKESV